jgi:hypothetical protein
MFDLTLTTLIRALPAPSVAFTTPYDSKAVAGYVARLRLAEKLDFAFPQRWFNVPAILKVSSTGCSCPAWRVI